VIVMVIEVSCSPASGVAEQVLLVLPVELEAIKTAHGDEYTIDVLATPAIITENASINRVFFILKISSAWKVQF